MASPIHQIVGIRDRVGSRRDDQLRVFGDRDVLSLNLFMNPICRNLVVLTDPILLGQLLLELGYLLLVVYLLGLWVFCRYCLQLFLLVISLNHRFGPFTLCTGLKKVRGSSIRCCKGVRVLLRLAKLSNRVNDTYLRCSLTPSKSCKF